MKHAYNFSYYCGILFINFGYITGKAKFLIRTLRKILTDGQTELLI